MTWPILQCSLACHTNGISHVCDVCATAHLCRSPIAIVRIRDKLAEAGEETEGTSESESEERTGAGRWERRKWQSERDKETPVDIPTATRVSVSPHRTAFKHRDYSVPHQHTALLDRLRPVSTRHSRREDGSVFSFDRRCGRVYGAICVYTLCRPFDAMSQYPVPSV